MINRRTLKYIGILVVSTLSFQIYSKTELVQTEDKVSTILKTLNIEDFKKNILELSTELKSNQKRIPRDRTQGSRGFLDAAKWIEGELSKVGLKTEKHLYKYRGSDRFNLYTTIVGSESPKEMYIISAHLDGRGGGGAANDDASGSSLVLEAAKAFSKFKPKTSIRFIFWNNEETGLNGSKAYVKDRSKLQGTSEEPTWLGVIQHDMMLFDHGLPPQKKQIPGADVDIEYKASVSKTKNQAKKLAEKIHGMISKICELNEDKKCRQAEKVDREIGKEMSSTDSIPFTNYTASVSLRENKRLKEIGKGSDPHWHKKTDVYETFSEQDFLLGFTALRLTVAAVSDLTL